MSAPTDGAILGDLYHHIDAVVCEYAEQIPVAEDGFIIGGSFDPETGYAAVLDGPTYAIIPDDPPPGDSMVNREKIPQYTMFPGFQYNPAGAERAVILPSPDGGGIVYKHWTDTSPSNTANAGSVPLQPGEFAMLHRTVASQPQPNQAPPPAAFDAGIHISNDGPTQGDGLGGTHVGHMGALTKAVTNSGHQVTLDDTAQTITVETASQKLSSIYDDTIQQIKTQAASGLYHVFDGQNNLISLVVPGGSGGLLTLGDKLSNLDTTFSAMNQKIMNDTSPSGYAGLLNTMVLSNLQTYITALTTALTAGGLANPSAFSSSMVATIVAGWLTKIGSVNGSSIVRIAS